MGGSRLRPALSGIIRRILRTASMTGIRTIGRGGRHQDGLESVKKTLQVVWVGTGLPLHRLPCSTKTTTSTRPGYVIDDGPRNEAPGDADCGVSRRGADRPDRDVLVSQPGRPAPGGRGADPRRHRARSGDQWQHRCLGVSRQLRLLSRRRAEGRRHRRPRALGRRADREFAPAAAVAAALRDRRRHDAASAYPRRPRRQWREQLDAVHRHHRAHHEARRRQPGVVLGNQDPGRRAQLRGRHQPRLRNARRYRPVAGMAVDLALVCRDRAIRLARRARRRLGQRQRLRRRIVGRPLRPEGAARQRAAETGVRRHGRQPHQHDDGRHADHRQRVAAQRAALDRPGAARAAASAASR